jgi:hypothetical protein
MLQVTIEDRPWKETVMDIVYAAEKPSIADVLSVRLRDRIRPQDIEVAENPHQTGSFLVRWRLRNYVVSPNGDVEPVIFA